MFTKRFWKDTTERAVRTFAQSLVSLWGGDQLNLWNLDWQQTAGAAGGAAVIAVLTAVAWPANQAPAGPVVEDVE